MKRIILSAVVLVMVASVAYAQQTAVQIQKERAKIAKMAKNELAEKASKDARKAAKEYVKDGWEVAPGQLPLEKQLDRSYVMQYQYDDYGFPKFIMAEAMAIGQNYDAAKFQALDLAKINLAGQIQTEVTTLVETSLANKQLANEDAVSISETVASSKNLIAQSIGRIIPVVECYRTKPNKNKEVRVMIAYNSQMAMNAAKNAIRQQLQEKGEKLHEQLDKVLGF